MLLSRLSALANKRKLKGGQNKAALRGVDTIMKKGITNAKISRYD